MECIYLCCAKEKEMPCDYSKYPPNWKSEIRPAALERAGNKCEICGAENGEYGYRDKRGVWWASQHIDDILHNSGRDLFEAGEWLDHCWDRFGNPTKPTKIVLTIAHFYNPDPMDCRPENLKALCQRCHLHHDKEQHQTNARRTRERKAGLQRLFAE